MQSPSDGDRKRARGEDQAVSGDYAIVFELPYVAFELSSEVASDCARTADAVRSLLVDIGADIRVDGRLKKRQDLKRKPASNDKAALIEQWVHSAEYFALNIVDADRDELKWIPSLGDIAWHSSMFVRNMKKDYVMASCLPAAAQPAVSGNANVLGEGRSATDKTSCLSWRVRSSLPKVTAYVVRLPERGGRTRMIFAGICKSAMPLSAGGDEHFSRPTFADLEQRVHPRARYRQSRRPSGSLSGRYALGLVGSSPVRSTEGRAEVCAVVPVRRIFSFFIDGK